MRGKNTKALARQITVRIRRNASKLGLGETDSLVEGDGSRQQPLAAERDGVQFFVRSDCNLALIHGGRRLAAQRDSVIADSIRYLIHSITYGEIHDASQRRTSV